MLSDWVAMARGLVLAGDRVVGRSWRLIVDGLPVLQVDGTNPRITPIPVDEAAQFQVLGVVEALDLLRVRLIAEPAVLARLRPAARYQVDFGAGAVNYVLKKTERSRVQGGWITLILQSSP